MRKVMNEKKIEIKDFHVPAKAIALIVDSLSSGKISVTASKEVFARILAGKNFDEMSEIFRDSEKDLSIVSDTSEIETIVRKILVEFPEETDRYKSGEKKLAGFLVGKIMQESKGKANPKIVNELLIKLLEV